MGAKARSAALITMLAVLAVLVALHLSGVRWAPTYQRHLGDVAGLEAYVARSPYDADAWAALGSTYLSAEGLTMRASLAPTALREETVPPPLTVKEMTAAHHAADAFRHACWQDTGADAANRVHHRTQLGHVLLLLGDLEGAASAYSSGAACLPVSRAARGPERAYASQAARLAAEVEFVRGRLRAAGAQAHLALQLASPASEGTELAEHRALAKDTVGRIAARTSEHAHDNSAQGPTHSRRDE